MRILSGIQPGGALHIGNQIDTTMFFSRANQRKRAASGLLKVMRKKPNPSRACTKLRCSSVACYARLSSRRWDCHGHQRELQDREDDTQNKGRINCNLENAATFFFRPDY